MGLKTPDFVLKEGQASCLGRRPAEPFADVCVPVFFDGWRQQQQKRLLVVASVAAPAPAGFLLQLLVVDRWARGSMKTAAKCG